MIQNNDRPWEREKRTPNPEIKSESNGILRFLLLERDSDQSPCPTVPDGTIIERLYALAKAESASTMLFDESEIATLAHLASVDGSGFQVIITDSLRKYPGSQVLLDAYPSITVETATHAIDDVKKEEMQAQQSPARQLKNMLDKLRQTDAHDANRRAKKGEPQTEEEDILEGETDHVG